MVNSTKFGRANDSACCLVLLVSLVVIAKTGHVKAVKVSGSQQREYFAEICPQIPLFGNSNFYIAASLAGAG
jgi:hypothetical protein